MISFTTNSENETIEIGRRLGALLQPGDVVCLSGDLGTGKTILTKGIAKGLGIDEHITSPTFTIVNEYDGKIPLYHFDVYRIGGADEMFETGFEEYLDNDGAVVIEWAGTIKEILPDEAIRVNINKICDDSISAYETAGNAENDRRQIDIEFAGMRYAGYEKKLRENQPNENNGV